jgi:hypothetical protein
MPKKQNGGGSNQDEEKGPALICVFFSRRSYARDG